MRALRVWKSRRIVTMPERPPFHLAFPVDDLNGARRFYGELLGCREGRSAEEWIDFDFYGHQIVAHLAATGDRAGRNPVDGDMVPVRHFGVVLEMAQWHEVAKRLKNANAEFIVEPHVRFAGQPGEQATLFVRDPSGNALEFKAFDDPARLFEK